MASGIPNRLYWTLTPAETGLLLEEIVAIERVREENAWNRAGTICASIYNTTPTDSKRVYKASDFFRMHGEPDKPKQSLAEVRARFAEWAGIHNAKRKGPN